MKLNVPTFFWSAVSSGANLAGTFLLSWVLINKVEPSGAVLAGYYFAFSGVLVLADIGLGAFFSRNLASASGEQRQIAAASAAKFYRLISLPIFLLALVGGWVTIRVSTVLQENPEFVLVYLLSLAVAIARFFFQVNVNLLFALGEIKRVAALRCSYLMFIGGVGYFVEWSAVVEWILILSITVGFAVVGSFTFEMLTKWKSVANTETFGSIVKGAVALSAFTLLSAAFPSMDRAVASLLLTTDSLTVYLLATALPMAATQLVYPFSSILFIAVASGEASIRHVGRALFAVVAFISFLAVVILKFYSGLMSLWLGPGEVLTAFESARLPMVAYLFMPALLVIPSSVLLAKKEEVFLAKMRFGMLLALPIVTLPLVSIMDLTGYLFGFCIVMAAGLFVAMLRMVAVFHPKG